MVFGRVHFLALISLCSTFPVVTAWMGLWSAEPPTIALTSFAAIVGATALMVSLLLSAKKGLRVLIFVAIAIVALVPEFSVETRYAWLAVGDNGAEFASLTLATVSGSSRILFGVAWPVLILLFWMKNRGARLHLGANHLAGLALLLVTSLYVFLIFIRGFLWVLDTPILLMMLMVYVWRLSRSQEQEDDSESGAQPNIRPFALNGVSAGLLFAYAIVVSFWASRLFADNVLGGTVSAVDTFGVLQWTIPIASKLPLIAAIAALVWQRRTSSSASMLLTSQITLWSVLVGILPLVMLLRGAELGAPDLVWFEDRQSVELLVTAFQTVFAVALISGNAISWKTALILFGLFGAELALSAIQPQSDSTLVQGLFSMLYLGGAITIFLKDRSRLWALGGAVSPARRAASLPYPITRPLFYTADSEHESRSRTALPRHIQNS